MRMAAYHTSKPQRWKTTHYFLPASMDKTALAQAVGEDDLDRADQPSCAVGDHQQRRPEPAVHQLAQEPGPGIMALAGAWRQADQHRRALGGDPPGGKHRLGWWAGVHAKVGAVQEQVLKLHARQVTQLPGVELVLDLLADTA